MWLHLEQCKTAFIFSEDPTDCRCSAFLFKVFKYKMVVPSALQYRPINERNKTCLL